ncbi:MAG: hypothetical protein NVSMB26_24040 [Beijerinckiaceae bacterium]
MSIRKNATRKRRIRAGVPLAVLGALGVLVLSGLSPAFAQQPPPDPSDPPPRTAKPAKKPIAPRAQSAELPAIGGPAIKQKAATGDKPKVKRPFGELEGWSSSTEAEKKVLPQERDQSSGRSSPVRINNSGNIGLGLGF